MATTSLRTLVRNDHEGAAKAASLRYVSEGEPGLRRVRRGRGFGYVDAAGRAVRDPATLERVRKLAIPPAWTEVWICPDGRGHIQALGRDARGRKQYKYHEQWREVRDEVKFGRMIAFARALPRLRRRVRQDLRKPGLPREKVLAAAVRVLERTFVRVGNEEYTRQNGSYGLTTLRNHHAKVDGHVVRLRFRGKGGSMVEADLEDPRLARILRKCQELPGQDLFGYIDDHGNPVDVKSQDVNDYLREITGEDFTAKDFRTWAATVLAALALQEMGGFERATQRKKHVVQAVKKVAEQLGNTPAVCRKCYIHPAVLDAYLDNALVDSLAAGLHKVERGGRGLSADERAVLGLLRQRLRQERTRRGRAGRRAVAAPVVEAASPSRRNGSRTPYAARARVGGGHANGGRNGTRPRRRGKRRA